MVVVGLTGGMGTGKSEVSRMLQDLDAVLINADQVGHETYAPGTGAWRDVVDAFGEEVLHPSGEIDRRKLGSIVFNDPQALAQLNAIMHPRMAGVIDERIGELKKRGVGVIVLEAALLIEANWTPLTDEVWVVTAPEDTAVQRIRARSGLAEDAIRARIRTQLPQEERVRRADAVIGNAGSLEELRQAVTDLWKQRILARQVGNGPR
jgi:dephospho-CoA kinase